MREPQVPATDVPSRPAAFQPATSKPVLPELVTSEPGERRKGPLSFLSGALTSGLLCVLCLRLSRGLALHFALHPSTSSSRLAQSIATALKTLLVGTSFLATFSFGFIGLGLSLVFLRSLRPAAAAAIADSSAADSDGSP